MLQASDDWYVKWSLKVAWLEYSNFLVIIINMWYDWVIDFLFHVLVHINTHLVFLLFVLIISWHCHMWILTFQTLMTQSTDETCSALQRWKRIWSRWKVARGFQLCSILRLSRRNWRPSSTSRSVRAGQPPSLHFSRSLTSSFPSQEEGALWADVSISFSSIFWCLDWDWCP